MSELIIAEQYKVIKDITKGRSAKVCEGISLKNGKAYAVKLQISQQSDSILREASILKNIQEDYTLMVDYGLPLCHCAGKQGKYNFVLIDLYSDTLLTLLQKCKGIFKIKTFIMLAEQMLKRLQFLHRQGYLHHSISLKKFMIGLNNNSKKLYLVGLGKGKRYIKDGVHIPFKDKLKVKGDKRYISINQHLGLQHSRRDDLESLMYCWIIMLYGKLPWQKQTVDDKILSKKIQNSGEVVFAQFPSQLQDIYNYSRKLSFNEEPDYEYLRNNILKLYEIYGVENDYDYDWQQSKFFDLQVEGQADK